MTLQEKYEKQKEINKELVDENEALKFAARMSEKTELQLREKNKDLADCGSILLSQAAAATKRIIQLEKENAELKEELKNWKDEWQKQVQKAIDEGYARTQQTIQLTKAKEIIKSLLATPRSIYGRDEDGELTPFFNPDYEELKKQAEQFLKEAAE